MQVMTRFGAACALALALAGCSDPAPGRGGGGAEIVTTEVVRMQPWNDTLRALGTVQARESVTVTAKVSETVEQVHFDSGDVVTAGAPLVTLSGRQQRAALAEAEAAANEASRLYERQANLAEQQLIARAMLDSQRATRDAANARVAQIRAQLGDRVVRAPFAGVLGLRQVSPGSLVTPGTAIATLDDLARVYVDFPVPETAIAQLAAGRPLTATSAAYPGREFTGTVATVDSRIDPATRSVTVRGDFPNAEGLLRPGMLLQVTLIRPEREALLVPEIAVVQVGNSSFVYRVKDDDTVERVNIEVGARRGGLAEVLSGLQSGDRIVVDGTAKLRPGAKIEVRPTGAGAGAGAGAENGDPEAAETEAEARPARGATPPAD
ncbi:efflux RND transporter periplasmic adaptor subunit [Novilysobacter arseniciresistens]|uniref:efflux RND transporter periplasmic adaptor subunit n=1 Tax=Novilysobacter arseniciresistens TaxID=1385522 RepID=UPI0009E07613|nr:efflux RND transporter periplasmic adaptor subunit [Lysobacter arseniciresistens]